MLDINLKQLEVFVTTAEYGSFTRAADVLYLSQSPVSSHIRSLEETLGVLLLEPCIISFVTLTARFVQAAQRSRVELKNGGCPAAGSGKYIGVVALVVHDVAQVIFLHVVHEGGAVHLQHPVTEKCLITGQRLTEVLRHGDALSGVDRKKLHLDLRGVRVAIHLNAVGVAFIGAG